MWVDEIPQYIAASESDIDKGANVLLWLFWGWNYYLILLSGSQWYCGGLLGYLPGDGMDKLGWWKN